jgi:hypothetical protein
VRVRQDTHGREPADANSQAGRVAEQIRRFIEE